MSDDLVKRLRDWEHVWPEDEDEPEGNLYITAADRIEALEIQNKRDAMQYLADVQRLEDSISELETKLAKAIAALRITDKWLRELDLYANPDYHIAPELKSVRDTLAELTGADR